MDHREPQPPQRVPVSQTRQVPRILRNCALYLCGWHAPGGIGPALWLSLAAGATSDQCRLDTTADEACRRERLAGVQCRLTPGCRGEGGGGVKKAIPDP